MKNQFNQEYNDSMDTLRFSDQAKEAMIQRLMAENRPQEKGHRPTMKKALYIGLAAVLLVGALTGAAVYTRWSAILPQAESTTQAQREQAERTGLSTAPQQNLKNGDITSVTQNGVTISVRQTLADRTSARLVFTISGWKAPEGRQPFMMPELRFEGDPGSYSADGEFYHKPFDWENHVAIYPDGTPVPLDKDGDPIYIYETDAGDIEFMLTINANNLADCFGKKVFIDIDSLGTSELTDYTPELEGPWNLSWTLTGSESVAVTDVDQPIGETGILVKEVTLSPLSVEVLLQLKEEFKDFDEEPFRPDLAGYRTKDGTEHINLHGGGSEGYEDREKGLYRLRRSSDGIVDFDAVDALLFRDWDEAGNTTTYTVELP